MKMYAKHEEIGGKLVQMWDCECNKKPTEKFFPADREREIEVVNRERAD